MKKIGSSSTLRTVLRRLRVYRWQIALTLFFAAVQVAATLYVPILVGRAIDCIVAPGRVDFAAIATLLITVAVITAVGALAQWLMNLTNNAITYRTVQDMRRDAFRRIQILPLSYLDRHPVGEIVSRVVADVDQFADGLLMGFTQLFTGAITIVGTIGFMLSIHPGITLIVVLITPLSLFVAAFIAKRTHTFFRAQAEARGAQTALIDEMIGGQKVVRAFGMEARVLDRFDAANETLRAASLKAIFFSSLTNPCTRFVNSMVYAAVGVVGALVAITGGLSVGDLTTFLSYANQYTKPFNEISGV
ncbi:MAG: ABC transporter ATP-binding protein, partial [Clostridia bacterium]|nr:ABC transporter ATP-binding protein [Clostridia bacterium]